MAETLTTDPEKKTGSSEKPSESRGTQTVSKSKPASSPATTSLSRKSASGTTKFHERFKRKPRFRHLNDWDWPYLWAAYQMGMWQDFLGELDQEEFRTQILRWMETVDLDWMLEAEHKGKVRPVGLVLGEFRIGGRGIEPHVDWFPWCTPRIRVEAAAHFLREIRKEYKVFVYSEPKDASFWMRLKKYRLIQSGCKIPDYFGPGEDAQMFYTQGPFA